MRAGGMKYLYFYKFQFCCQHIFIGSRKVYKGSQLMSGCSIHMSITFFFSCCLSALSWLSFADC